MIFYDLDDYYIVFDTKNRNIELDTLFSNTTKHKNVGLQLYSSATEVLRKPLQVDL